MSDNVLVKLGAAQNALAECKTVMEAKSIADVAEAARVYLERTNASTETVNRATEIRILAERQMGEFLKQMPKAKGGDRFHKESTAPREGAVVTLKEIGIDDHQSSRAQKLADIPAAEFNDRVAVAKVGGKLSTAKVLRPTATRRSAEVFSFSEWKRHTATMLDLRFRGVPEDSREQAAEYITEFIQRYLP